MGFIRRGILGETCKSEKEAEWGRGHCWATVWSQIESSFALIYIQLLYAWSVSQWLGAACGKKVTLTSQARWLSLAKGNSPKKVGICQQQAATTHSSWRMGAQSWFRGSGWGTAVTTPFWTGDRELHSQLLHTTTQVSERRWASCR